MYLTHADMQWLKQLAHKWDCDIQPEEFRNVIEYTILQDSQPERIFQVATSIPHRIHRILVRQYVRKLMKGAT